MTGFLAVLQYAVAAAFLLLALSAAVDAVQHRERARTYLALGLCMFALVPIIARVQAGLATPSVPLQYVSALAFLGSGYAVLLFRAAYLPLSRSVHAVVAGGVAGG